MVTQREDGSSDSDTSNKRVAEEFQRIAVAEMRGSKGNEDQED